MTDKYKEEKYSRFLETEEELKDKRIRNKVHEFDSLTTGDMVELIMDILKRYAEYRPALFEVGYNGKDGNEDRFNIFNWDDVKRLKITPEVQRKLLQTIMTIIVKNYDLHLDMVTFASLKYGIKIGFDLKTQVPCIAKIPDSVVKMNNDAMKSYEKLSDKQTKKIIQDMQEELKKEGWIVAENKKGRYGQYDMS